MMMVSNRNLLFQGLIFRFHVNLQGCIIKMFFQGKMGTTLHENPHILREPPSVLAGVRHRSPHRPLLRLTRPLPRLHEWPRGENTAGPCLLEVEGYTVFSVFKRGGSQSRIRRTCTGAIYIYINMRYKQNFVRGEGTSLSRVDPYGFCSGGTLDKPSSGYRFRHRWRLAAPMGFVVMATQRRSLSTSSQWCVKEKHMKSTFRNFNDIHLHTSPIF